MPWDLFATGSSNLPLIWRTRRTCATNVRGLLLSPKSSYSLRGLRTTFCGMIDAVFRLAHTNGIFLFSEIGLIFLCFLVQLPAR